MTDVRKAANRVTFNQPEEEVLDGDEVRQCSLCKSTPQTAHSARCWAALCAVQQPLRVSTLSSARDATAPPRLSLDCAELGLCSSSPLGSHRGASTDSFSS